MGEKREAVRVYEQRTGANHRDALRAVARLAKQHGAFDQTSAFFKAALGLIVLILAAAGIVAAVIFLTK
jgi:hypothetical protein